MTLEGNKKSLISYRLESAREKLSAAQDLLAKGHYKDSVSRSYYAIFTAARALLAVRQLDSHKHSGVIALFNQHFVKSGTVRKETSKWLERGKLYREQADYGDFYIVSLEEAEAQIQSAREFIDEIESAVERILMLHE
jgi:uncharacterized protein (UPF0332 family)